MIFGELEFKQIGRLASAPSFRKNPDGSKVANFRVITNVGWKDKASGEFKDRAEGFRFELWGDSAERLSELPTGQEIYVVAEPYNHRYEHNGETRYEVRFRVTRWRELGRKAAPGSPDAAAGGDSSGDPGDVPF